MTQLWVRAESRTHEARVGLMPAGAAQLIAAGIKVTVEESAQRGIPLQDYVNASCDTAAEGS